MKNIFCFCSIILIGSQVCCQSKSESHETLLTDALWHELKLIGPPDNTSFFILAQTLMTDTDYHELADHGMHVEKPFQKGMNLNKVFGKRMSSIDLEIVYVDNFNHQKGHPTIAFSPPLRVENKQSEVVMIVTYLDKTSSYRRGVLWQYKDGTYEPVREIFGTATTVD